MATPDGTLAGTFNFHVTLSRSAGTGSGLDQLGDGGFQECSGLDVEMDVLEFPEGGRNDGVIRRIGRGKYSRIVLKRGMLVPPDGKAPDELWRWIQDILRGGLPVPRFDGVIELLDHAGEPDGVVVATWEFDRGLPAKIAGPQLNARTGEVAIEELTIAHEGLRMRAI